MEREEHLEWCKTRAREYLDQGDVSQAIASMLSDLDKHASTRTSAKMLGPLGLFEAAKGGLEGARRFIEGFN